MSSYLELKGVDLSVNGVYCNGIVRVKSVSLGVTKKETLYAMGKLLDKNGDEVEYKCWDSDWSKLLNNVFSERNKQNQQLLLDINGSTNVYNGQTSIIIKDSSEILEVQEQLNEVFSGVTDEDKHNSVEWFNHLKGVLQNNLSKTGQSALKAILDKAILKKFASEYAAISVHDARYGGLVHHTTKMLELLELIMKQNNNFGLNQKGIDLMYLGITIHDIGKIYEYQLGDKSNKYYVQHQALGIEYLVGLKDSIIELYNEDFYYQLMAIINQHHGKWEARPHTVFVYLIHLIDTLDASTTYIADRLEQAKEAGSIRVLDRDIPELFVDGDYFL